MPPGTKRSPRTGAERLAQIVVNLLQKAKPPQEAAVIQPGGLSATSSDYGFSVRLPVIEQALNRLVHVV